MNFSRFGAALVIASFAAGAAQAMEPEDCHELAASTVRLACYDSVTGFATEPVEASAWILAERQNAITGANTSGAMLTADLAEHRDSPRHLFLSCDGAGGVDVFIVADGYIGSVDDRVRVTYRWNENDPVTSQWDAATTGQAAFVPSFRHELFVGNLQDGGRLAVEWEDFRGSRSSGVWNNVQLDENAQFILGGCQG